MHLDLTYLATDPTGEERYADTAMMMGPRMMAANVCREYTGFHLATVDDTGVFVSGFTAQGYADASVRSRRQTWAVYVCPSGFAYRTEALTETSCPLADVFLSLLVVPQGGIKAA